MFRRFPLVLPALLLAGCWGGSQPESNSVSVTATPPPQPGLLDRMWESTQNLNPLKPSLKTREMKPIAPPNLRAFTATMAIDPPAPKLSEVRQMRVTLSVVNRGKKVVTLDFPTTQRIDAVIKDSTGKMIEHWSDDHRFEAQPGIVTVNPGERLEYSALVATREMQPDKPFTVEAWLPNYESIRAATTITPVK